MIEPRAGWRPGIALLGLALLVMPGCSGGEEPAGNPVLEIQATGGPVTVRVEIADSPEERQQGLMGREQLAPDAGMVFLHDEPSSSGFWMKDTLIPLSVAFWDEEQRIIGIVDMEPCRTEPCEIYPAPGPWVGALEVNQGFFEQHGVALGDRVVLPRI